MVENTSHCIRGKEGLGYLTLSHWLRATLELGG